MRRYQDVALRTADLLRTKVRLYGLTRRPEDIPRLRAHGIRVEIDSSDDRMPKKIRNHTKAKVPFLLIAGEDDRAAGAVSFRFRDGRQDNGVPVDEAVDRIVEAVRTRVQV